jgi:hypothetical protein
LQSTRCGLLTAWSCRLACYHPELRSIHSWCDGGPHTSQRRARARLGTSGPAEPETYRFLWLRSFHHPVVIRLSHMRRGGFIVSTELDGAGGYAPGRQLRRDSVRLSDDTWTSFQALIAREAFWTRLTTDTAHQGLDGADWIIEATRGGRYIIVERWAPATNESAAFMRRLGLEFLRLGRVSVPAADVY